MSDSKKIESGDGNSVSESANSGNKKVAKIDDVFFVADQKLVQAAKSIKILSSLGWNESHCDNFLSSWRRGNPILPDIKYPKFDFSNEKLQLKEIINTTSEDHPVGYYIVKTAHSYSVAAQMLEGLETSAFRECSEILYGRPSDHLGKLSNLELADDFISITDDFSSMIDLEDDTGVMHSLKLAEAIKSRADDFFKDYSIKVVVDDELSSKAAAGSERVRVRGQSTFSLNELEQLLQHEVFVHSATMLNGRRQPYLKSMGLGSPRTTATQEGLATFAELISGTMDLGRLRRIALRIKGIDLALNGANFIETFKFFLDSGQSEKESYLSTARIFRGGDVKGRNVFTKDVVYLKGLISVHTFMRKAIQQRKIDYPQRLFSGRMTVGDVIRFEDAFKDGWIEQGKYLPPWAANRQGLATYLCYNAFSNRLKLEEVKMEDFSEDIVDPMSIE
ncbi:MAG: flavohemoglobin expression-modulating QEGLA motif protein [Proteobacteria bacterium]|nr:flavohemoglobin expression-modulating QEGLA motif protein [Pseudomonadota bacterium]